MRLRACSPSLALVLLTSAIVTAQTPATMSAFSADLPRYYFKTPEEEVAARAELNTALDQMASFKGKIDSAGQLLCVLQRYDSVRKLFARHERYLHLRCSINRKDKDSACEADRKLESEVDAKTAFLDTEILALPEERLRAFFNEQPALVAYRFALSEIRRDAPHLLPADEQALLDQFEPEIADWQDDLYRQIVSGISFGTVQTTSHCRQPGPTCA
jgi:oligoendopeptidase F